MTDLAKFPITLEAIVFTRSVVIAILDHERDPKVPIAVPVNTVNVAPMDESGSKFSVTMKMVINSERSKASPYFADMECSATFAVDDTLKGDEATRGVMIVAHNVLYGAIRESVAWITSRQPYGPLILGLSVLQGPAKPAEAKPAQ